MEVAKNLKQVIVPRILKTNNCRKCCSHI